MAKFILMIAFSVLVCDNIGRVLCASKCKTHADCKSLYIHYRCCGGSMILGGDANVKERSCWFSSCLYRYCANDSDCSDQLCCRSNKCVRKGCNGCAKNSDCNIGHVCCKNTLPLDQTVCGDNCINQTCNSNDDCAGQQECCRSGKCTRGCSEKCASDSECNLDEYCCNKRQRYWGDNCAKTCVGELCTTDRDCGARNECCISNKCVDRGCSGCITNSNCSTGHYCCKEGQSYSDKISVCSVNCIGKFCRTTKECGGPGETCGSSNKCAVQTSKASSTNSFPPWLIAVLTISLVVFFTAVGVLVAVFGTSKERVRPMPALKREPYLYRTHNFKEQEFQVINRTLNFRVQTLKSNLKVL
ncbi:keratin-associated protein 5-3-like [Dendronephthya gigantea]|uniref:keratin-associated protein 5-3-like n=1 Tax=Dendronephthya gigantea TaxID=151771 RepID=UPI00106A199B|nr:keratin-associated protein 5-3-like [Dendronephthya gigantea]